MTGGEAMDPLQKHLDEIMQSVSILQDSIHDSFCEATELVLRTLRDGGKVLVCGNGGSAADAQHFAAELVASLHGAPFPRALPVMALTINSSTLTAIANDDHFDNVFARQVEAFAQAGDIVIGLSTSGRSPNILLALEAGSRAGASTIALVGSQGLARSVAQCEIRLPSTSTQVIQTLTMIVLHVLCEQVESLR